MEQRRSWALVTLDRDGEPSVVLMLLDDEAEAEEIAIELRRSGRRVLVVPFGGEREHQTGD